MTTRAFRSRTTQKSFRSQNAAKALERIDGELRLLIDWCPDRVTVDEVIGAHKVREILRTVVSRLYG